MKRFEGKVAVVTGGANGIGAVIVARLVSEGAMVMIADLSPPVNLSDDVRFTKTDVAIGRTLPLLFKLQSQPGAASTSWSITRVWA